MLHLLHSSSAFNRSSSRLAHTIFSSITSSTTSLTQPLKVCFKPSTTSAQHLVFNSVNSFLHCSISIIIYSYLFDIRVITLSFKLNVITEIFSRHCIHPECFSFILLSISTSSLCLADAPTSASALNQFPKERTHHTHHDGISGKFHHLCVGETACSNLCDIISLNTHKHKSFTTT